MKGLWSEGKLKKVRKSGATPLFLLLERLRKWYKAKEGGVLSVKTFTIMSLSRSIFVFGAVLLCFALWPPASSKPLEVEASQREHLEADVEKIRRLIQDYAEAIARMDISAIERLTIATDDYSVIEGGHANWGWASYRDRHLEPEFSSPNFRITGYDVVRIYRIHVDRNMAFSVIRYEIRANVNGKRVSRKKFSTIVFYRTKDGWKIIHEHS